MSKFCTACGQANVARSKFCPHCGSAFAASPASAAIGAAAPMDHSVASGKPVLLPNLTPGSLINLAGRVGLGVVGLWVLCVVGAIVLGIIGFLMVALT